MTTMPPPQHPQFAQSHPQQFAGRPPAQHMPPQQYAAPLSYPPQQPSGPRDLSWLLGVVSVAAVVLGLSVDEDGANQWDRVNAWGGLAVVAALLTLAPVLGRTFGWTVERARQAAGCGAGALVLFWVLFTLPVVGSNTSLATTIGVGAGAAAAALSRP